MVRFRPWAPYKSFISNSLRCALSAPCLSSKEGEQTLSKQYGSWFVAVCRRSLARKAPDIRGRGGQNAPPRGHSATRARHRRGRTAGSWRSSCCRSPCSIMTPLPSTRELHDRPDPLSTSRSPPSSVKAGWVRSTELPTPSSALTWLSRCWDLVLEARRHG